MKLLIQAITKYILGLILVGALLFIPAKTFQYWNAWLFLGLLFIPMFIVGIILFIKNKELLEKRLNAKEKQKEQKEVLICSSLMFITGFIIAGLNYQYKWMLIPKEIVIGAAIIFEFAYGLYAEVLRENAYLSRIIEVTKEQKIISTGLYGVIRHPMYSSTILLFLSMFLILGSPQSFMIFLIYPILMIKRIKNEEKILEQELPGYKDYQKKVKYRLIPYIW